MFFRYLFCHESRSISLILTFQFIAEAFMEDVPAAMVNPVPAQVCEGLRCHYLRW